jgi:hypothetical protein
VSEAEEKIGEYRIYFRVIESLDDRLMHIPTQATVLSGTQKQCLDELRSWVSPDHYLDILEVLKEN